jgi:hypothetical protein
LGFTLQESGFLLRGSVVLPGGQGENPASNNPTLTG